MNRSMDITCWWRPVEGSDGPWWAPLRRRGVCDRAGAGSGAPDPVRPAWRAAPSASAAARPALDATPSAAAAWSGSDHACYDADCSTSITIPFWIQFFFYGGKMVWIWIVAFPALFPGYMGNYCQCFGFLGFRVIIFQFAGGE